MTAPRSWLVLTDGHLTTRNAKTAHGVLRYGRDRIAAVLDPEHAGSDLADVLPSLGRKAPIVATLEEGLRHEPTSLLLGVATAGGWIPDHWRPWLLEAIDAGLEIANGLHRLLHDDAELVEHASRSGATLWDVRVPPPDVPLFSGLSLQAPQKIVATVGSDCAVGKMTVSLELAEEGRRAGHATEFVATGQTGILIAGRGIAIDRVISDFASGAAEKLVVDSQPDSEVLLIEGQGGLWHPAYAGVTLSLLHGSAPHVLVLCHKAGHLAIEEPPYTELPPLAEMVEVYEGMAATVRSAKVACVAVNCGELDAAERRSVLADVETATGLPAGDVLNGDAARLWSAIEEQLRKIM